MPNGHGHKIKNLQDVEAYLGATAPARPEIPPVVVDALVANYMGLKELVGDGDPNTKNQRFGLLLIGMRDGNIWKVERLPRIFFLRSLFDVDICQLPLVRDRAAADREWVDFCRCARDAPFADRLALRMVGSHFGFSRVAPIRNNTEGMCRFKEVLNQINVAEIPAAIKIIARFLGINQPLNSYVTQLLMPDWVCVWRTSPPGTKPIDVAFNQPKLKPHFEKHVCHLTADPHPWQECVAWMEVLKYDDRITLDYLQTFLIKPTANHITIMFPDDAPLVASSAFLPTGKGPATQVKALAKTLVARECFITHYLCNSQRLVDSLWREFAARYEHIARDTLNACQDGFLYFERATGKIFFVGSVRANVKVGGINYFSFVMARFYSESKSWEFSTLYMPDETNNKDRIAQFRATGHLWDGAMSEK